MISSARTGECGVRKKMFRYSFLYYNYYTFFFSVAVILSGFSTTMAATAQTQWWTNPCSIQTAQIRHGRSPAENQLRIFIKMIDNPVSKDLKALYPNVAQKQINMNCPRVNSIVTLMTSAANFTQATRIFYQAMVEMAKFLHKLQEVPIVSSVQFNEEKRKHMYEEVEVNLRSLMCEFNDTLTRFEEKEPEAVPIRAIHRSISSKCLPKKMGLSKAFATDIDLFTKLRKFFRHSRRILRQKKRHSLGANKNNSNKSQPSNNKMKTKKNRKLNSTKIKRTKQ